MKLLTFNITIEAAPEKVWNILWNEHSYSRWTSVFQQGSRYEGNLEEGSIVRMCDSVSNGMYNPVLINTPYSQMKFKHLGWLYDGVEDPQDWPNSTESYQLQDLGAETQLTVTVNALEEFLDFFNSNLPKALVQIKVLAEQ